MVLVANLDITCNKKKEPCYSNCIIVFQVFYVKEHLLIRESPRRPNFPVFFILDILFSPLSPICDGISELLQVTSRDCFHLRRLHKIYFYVCLAERVFFHFDFFSFVCLFPHSYLTFCLSFVQTILFR